MMCFVQIHDLLFFISHFGQALQAHDVGNLRISEFLLLFCFQFSIANSPIWKGGCGGLCHPWPSRWHGRRLGAIPASGMSRCPEYNAQNHVQVRLMNCTLHCNQKSHCCDKAEPTKISVCWTWHQQSLKIINQNWYDIVYVHVYAA